MLRTSTVRRAKRPEHSLDLALRAIYQNGSEAFPEKSDVIRQPETLESATQRRLRKRRRRMYEVSFGMDRYATRRDMAGKVHRPQFEEQIINVCKRAWTTGYEYRTLSGQRVDHTHPLRHGGLKELRSPFSVKLGISSHHSPQSHDGYGRNSYGAFYTS